MACSVACVAIACSLAVDTSGLSSGGSASPATDASDAPVDAPADATNVSDAPVDARPDGPPARPCATPHAICEDFDNPSGARSLSPILDNGGQVIDDDDHVSAPRSVICRTATSTRGNVRHLELQQLEEARGRQAGCLHVEGGVHARREAVEVGSQARSDENHPLPKLGDGTWHHVELDAKLARNGGNLTVTVDGSKVVDAQGIRTLTEGATGLRLVIGLYTNGVASPWDLKLDNVVGDPN